MSAERVARVLKKIKNECYKDSTYPDYYEEFFKHDKRITNITLVNFLEKITQVYNESDCEYTINLFRYLEEDKVEMLKPEYGDRLEIELKGI